MSQKPILPGLAAPAPPSIAYCRRCGCPATVHKSIGHLIPHADGGFTWPPYSCTTCGKRCVFKKGETPWFAEAKARPGKGPNRGMKL